MKKITITKADLDSNNNYKKGFIGKWNEYEDVSVEIEENLGYVVFEKGIYVNGSIIAKAGSGIKAGNGIKAGWGIEAGSGIEAGEGIEAGWGIEAGNGIKAGWGIEAGEGIVSLYSSIKAKLSIVIDARCRIVAGCMSYSGAKEVEAQEIKGEIAYGIKKLLPKEEVEKSLVGTEVTVTVGDKTYKAVIKE